MGCGSAASILQGCASWARSAALGPCHAWDAPVAAEGCFSRRWATHFFLAVSAPSLLIDVTSECAFKSLCGSAVCTAVAVPVLSAVTALRHCLSCLCCIVIYKRVFVLNVICCQMYFSCVCMYNVAFVFGRCFFLGCFTVLFLIYF